MNPLNRPKKASAEVLATTQAVAMINDVTQSPVTLWRECDRAAASKSLAENKHKSHYDYSCDHIRVSSCWWGYESVECLIIIFSAKYAGPHPTDSFFEKHSVYYRVLGDGRLEWVTDQFTTSQ